MKKIAIFISGRGSNMQAIAEACESGCLQGIAEVVLVFSNVPTAQGLAIAKQKKIPTANLSHKGYSRSEFDEQVLLLLASYSIDWIVLAGYARILSPSVVAAYRQQLINIHPADTQVHQGWGGYEWAYREQLSETKITIHYVTEELDKGAIIAQATVNLEGATSVQEVEKRGLAVEHQFYSKILYQLCLSKK